MNKVKYRYKIRLTPLGKALCVLFSVIGLSCFFYAAKTDSNSHNVQAKNSDILLSLNSNNFLLNISEVEEKILNNSKSVPPKPLMTINFSEGSSLVSNEYAERLDELVRILTSISSTKIIIEGNIASSNGSKVSQFEEQLSIDRAQVIENYLIEKGIKPSRIILISNLGYKPLESNNTANGRHANDRADIFLKIDP